jgi:hypothetical protein
MKLVKFGSSACTFRDDAGLPLALIERYAPSVFATEKHDSRSERYTQIRTVDVLRALMKEGFYIVEVTQGGSRIEGKRAYTKHMLRLRHPSWKAATGEALEILLYNAHDGTCSYRMPAGVFRFVCSNGLVCGDTFCDIKVKHTGKNVVEDVVQGCFEVLDLFPRIADNVALFKATVLPMEAARLLAANAIEVRYEDSIERNGHSPISVDEALQPRRFQDNAQDLWTVYNTVQENLVKGGLSYDTRDRNNRRVTRRTRPIQELDANTRFNQRLHKMADDMARIMNGIRSNVADAAE